MTYDTDWHHRRSIRLQGYDYAQAGAYFFTVCVQDRACLLGEVVEGEVVPSDAGRMILRWWVEVPRAFPGNETDAFVLMPNHVHGIVLLGTDPSIGAGAQGNVAVGDEGGHVGPPLPPRNVGADLRVRPASLPRLLQWFKTMTTNDYIRGVKQQGWPPFRGKLWQRNYYERIIRNDRELDRARAYIAGNPSRWSQDAENPAGRGG
jgi:REP element-mobilizing transposase RayT